MARGLLALFVLFMLSLALTIQTASAQPGKAAIYMVVQEALGQRLTDEEMDKIRGGIAGMFFGVHFIGSFINLDAVEGTLSVIAGAGGEALILPPIEITGDGDTQAIVTGGVQGGAAFQLNVVTGSNNIVSNTMVFNIAIVNVLNESALAGLSLSSLLGW